MPVNIGVNIQRSPNRINQQLREAGVEGKFPKLLLDFKDQYYLASGGSKTLANAVTHARSGNAVMTDGYGPELVVNGGFGSDSDWTKGTGWSIAGGKAQRSNTGSTTYLSQSVSFVAGKTYAVSYNLTRTSASGGFTVQFIGGTTSNGSFQNSSGLKTEFITANSGNVTLRLQGSSPFAGTIDNVSVREMPVLKWAPHNLLSYSAFDSATPTNWSVGFGTGTYNHTLGSEISNLPTITQEQTVSGRSYLTQNVTVKANTTYTLKMLVDENLSSITDGNNKILSANISGASGTLSASIDDVSDGKVEITFTTGSTTSGTVRAGIGVLNDAVGTVVFAAPHLYRSDLGGMVDNPDRGDSYVPTTSSAKYLPRIPHHVYNGNAWVNEGLLAESEARTNILPKSGEFSTWPIRTKVTVTDDAVISPDGNESASTVVTTTVSGEHYVQYDLTSDTGTFTDSAYVKADGYKRVFIRPVHVGATEGATQNVEFDVEAGTVLSAPSGTTGTIQDVGNGWYRIAATYTVSGTITGAYAFRVQILDNTGAGSYAGDGTSGIQVYGAQREKASTPSSFTPTSGSTVTRAAETFTIPSANLPWPEPQLHR